MTTVRSTEIYHDSNVRLIAVESIELRPGKTIFGFHVCGTIEPIAVIVLSPDGTYASGMDGQALDLDQLRKDIPHIWARMNSS